MCLVSFCIIMNSWIETFVFQLIAVTAFVNVVLVPALLGGSVFTWLLGPFGVILVSCCLV